MKSPFFSLLFLALIPFAKGAPVISWVAINGDAGFSGGSATTNSPITTDSDAETIVGSFPAVVLAIGDAIELSGSVTITGNAGTIPGNQFRWGIFDAPGVPATGVGGNYVGVWATSPTGGTAALVTANGSTANPFSGAASTAIVSAGDPEGDAPQFGNVFTFGLTITRLDATQISIAATLSDAGGLSIQWPATTTSASPGSFTYDSVGFLLGGTLNATSASFAMIEVTTSAPPSDTDNDGMPDDYEDANGLDKNLDDSALDLDGTNPNLADSDSDGLNDNVETNTGTFVSATNTGTNPLSSDSDGDGIPDGAEVGIGTDPNDPDSNFGQRLLGIDFNRSDALGSPSQSYLRVISGSIIQEDNSAAYTKKIGKYQIIVAQPDGTAFEFRGANGETGRAIPGGDISRSFLVADFVATREGSMTVSISGLPAGEYLWKSCHLDPITSANLGFAQGSNPTTPNVIEARIGGILKGTVQPTALGASGLGTTFIDDGQVP
ncbi:MAG: hypothetical protein ACJAVK_001413 [Akkermansiaceae bacterium]|jgi:hypothetical protein